MTSRASLTWWGLLPVALLVLVTITLSKSSLLRVLRSVPPVEELTFDRVTLAPGEIHVRVINGGPEAVTIAQVVIDDAFWAFKITPGSTVPRLGAVNIAIPYPWVEGEAHEITLMTSTGITFSREIPVAIATPKAGLFILTIFTAIGIYVGVIPVVIGLLWLPFLRRLEQKWIHFALALTAGLLVFLGVDALQEALETAASLAGAYQGSLAVLLGVVGTLLILQLISKRRAADSGPAARRAVALLVALGIGFHNLGEGLAIGAAYALGEATLGATLIVGFMIHNTTEGLAIVAPLAKDSPRVRLLAGLGLVAGGPTVIGAWIGGLAFSPLWATLFLSVGVGAILQVLLAIYRLVAREGSERAWSPLTATGLLAGLAVMYMTGLFVAF
jgi:zinc transporter, ZIP family